MSTLSEPEECGDQRSVASVPWLSLVPGRDVTTNDGRQLTLLNPASMLRQMMDLYAAEYGIRGLITGLRNLRAMFMEPGWDKCHGILGYQTGDMRGATGLKLSLSPCLAQEGTT